jgi:hypothetical protein
MKETYYKKVGKKYIPVSEYDSYIHQSLEEGYHLIYSKPGYRTTQKLINPDYAKLIGACYVAEQTLTHELMQSLKMRPTQPPLTEEQIQAWDNLEKSFKNTKVLIEYPSVKECVIRTMKIMQEEADKLMTNPTVRKAYENFMLVCELSKNQETK